MAMEEDAEAHRGFKIERIPWLVLRVQSEGPAQPAETLQQEQLMVLTE